VSPSREKWLRFFNTVLYERLASLYNAIDWLTFGAWWHLVRRALDVVPENQRVLEVGFGPGKLLTEMARQSDLCVGVDLAWGMCHTAQRRARKHQVAAHIVRGSGFELPFASDTFDVVVSTFALSGLPDGENVLREMARVTISGGRVVLVDIGLPTHRNRLGYFLAHLWEGMGDFLYDQSHMMQSAGLAVTTFTEFGPGEHIRVVVGEKP
jgi:ubiquinone/menaquinone biosynthesis C-methylase UbiE